MKGQRSGLITRITLLGILVASGMFVILREAPTVTGLGFHTALHLFISHLASVCAISVLLSRFSRHNQTPSWSASPIAGFLQYIHLGGWSCLTIGVLGCIFSPLGHAQSFIVATAFLGIGLGSLVGIAVGIRVGSSWKQRNAQPEN